MKRLTPFAAVALLGVLACTSFAASATHNNKAAVKKHVSLICPVTGEKIASIKDAVGSSTYKGTTYYFCCPSCKPMFDKDPSKYIKAMSQGHQHAM